MTISTPVRTSEQSIDRVLHAGLPLILVFDRKECPTCRQLEPALNRLAAEFAGRALIARVDVDENQTLARAHRVAALPALSFIRDGEAVAHAEGAADEAELRAWLKYLTIGGVQPVLPHGPSTAIARKASRVAPDAQARPSQSAAGPVTANDANFDQIVNRDQPVLVDFWASWCGPCRAVAPSVERLAQEFSGQAVVAKLNVDENPRTAQRFGISGIPALFIFKRGKIVERLVGAQPYATLRQALAKHTEP